MDIKRILSSLLLIILLIAAAGCSPRSNKSPMDVVTAMLTSVEKNDIKLFKSCFSKNDITALMKQQGMDEDAFDKALSKALGDASAMFRENGISISKITVEQPENYENLSKAEVRAVFKGEEEFFRTVRDSNGKWYMDINEAESIL